MVFSIKGCQILMIMMMMTMIPKPLRDYVSLLALHGCTLGPLQRPQHWAWAHPAGKVK